MESLEEIKAGRQAVRANIFIDWNMFCASLQLQLSQPSPTLTRLFM